MHRFLPTATSLVVTIGAHLSRHYHNADAFSSPASRSKVMSMPYGALNNSVSSMRPSSILYTSPTPSLISDSNHWGNVAALSFTASIAQLLGKRTFVGKLLGAPVTAMAVAFVLSSVGIIPSLPSAPGRRSEWMTVLPPGGSVASIFLQNTSLTLATPLLLLGTSLRGRALIQCGSLLGSFFIASFGTLAGAILALSVNNIPRALLASVPNQDGLKIAAALLAKNIGGGINYMAVCSCLNAGPESVAAGLCVDNVMALVYFPLVSLLASKYNDVVDADNDSSVEKEENEEVSEENGIGSLSPIESLSHAFTLAAVLTACGQYLNSKLHYVTTSSLNISLPITTLLTVIFSTYYPSNMFLSPTSSSKNASNVAKSNRIAKAGETLGTSLLYVFFATAGAPGWRLKESIQQSFPSIASFLIIMYGIHGATLWSFKRLVKLTKVDKSIKYWKNVVAPQRLLIASSAAIGGPATAAALAQSHSWDSLLTPSLLVGNVGYAVATFIGLLFYGAVKPLV